MYSLDLVLIGGRQLLTAILKAQKQSGTYDALDTVLSILRILINSFNIQNQPMRQYFYYPQFRYEVI